MVNVNILTRDILLAVAVTGLYTPTIRMGPFVAQTETMYTGINSIHAALRRAHVTPSHWMKHDSSPGKRKGNLIARRLQRRGAKANSRPAGPNPAHSLQQ